MHTPTNNTPCKQNMHIITCLPYTYKCTNLRATCGAPTETATNLVDNAGEGEMSPGCQRGQRLIGAHRRGWRRDRGSCWWRALPRSPGSAEFCARALEGVRQQQHREEGSVLRKDSTHKPPHAHIYLHAYYLKYTYTYYKHT